MKELFELSLISPETHKLPKEIEHGNVEYKLNLIEPTAERLQHLITQLKWRISEGFGEALYEIGIADNGLLIGLDRNDMDASLLTLTEMATSLNADISIIKEILVNNYPDKIVAEVLIRKCIQAQFLEIKIAVLGASDSGKSTLLGVLSHDELDNGRGKARLMTLKHSHEISTGRTSSISKQVIGFDTKGELINFASTNITCIEQICEASSKIITFLDCCGHPKYQKTTMRGITGNSPDYSCLIVAANAGFLSDTAKDHLAMVLNTSIFICLTKIDITIAEQLTSTLKSLLLTLKSPGIKRVPMVIKHDEDVVTCIDSFIKAKIIPIFLVSSVTGENINLFKKFLNLLTKPKLITPPDAVLDQEFEFQIEKVFSLPDVGTVVGGVLIAGKISIQNINFIDAYIGPDRGNFIPIRIQSLQRQRCHVKIVNSGDAATCRISFPNADQSSTNFKIRPGQFILAKNPKFAFWKFEAVIEVTFNTPTLKAGDKGIAYSGNVRQCVKIMDIEPEASSEISDHTKGQITGKGRRIEFLFLNEPEWLIIGRTIMFQGEGQIKCVGKITRLHEIETQIF